MSENEWTDLLEPGDLVVVEQGVGEPTGLLEQLLRVAPTIPDLEVFVGLSHSDALRSEAAFAARFVSFGAMGPVARLAAAGRVDIIPCRVADLARQLALRAPGRLVVLMQLAPADPAGRHSTGLSVDYTFELVNKARLVVAEVNEQLPVTSAPSVRATALSAVVQTSRPVPVVARIPVAVGHQPIAAHVAELIPDGATVQFGVGTVPSMIGSALASKRRLRVHSTLVGDWLLDLARAGALLETAGTVEISEAAGSPALYDYVIDRRVNIRPTNELMSPDALTGVDTFIAVNSALQVDLSGQVNAEQLDAGYVGGIGGQPDLFRAAQRTPRGSSVVALPATTRDGRSRIVAQLAGAVTTPRSDVDFVVTEHGVADLRGGGLQRRMAALVAVAAPAHRDRLSAGLARP